MKPQVGVGLTTPRKKDDHRHIPDPRPKHNEAATDEAETSWRCSESYMMRRGVVVAVVIG